MKGRFSGSEGRNDAALEGVENELAGRLGVVGVDERLHPVRVLVRGFDRDDVGVGAVGVLDEEGVAGRNQTRLDRIVVV